MAYFTDYPDLASRDLAGSVISANDELFAPRQNLIMPFPATHVITEFRSHRQDLQRLRDAASARTRS